MAASSPILGRLLALAILVAVVAGAVLVPVFSYVIARWALGSVAEATHDPRARRALGLVAAGVLLLSIARPLGARDYLTIAANFHTVLLQGVPKLTSDKRNEAARFIALIDALYEARVKLVATAAAEPEDLYPKGDGSFEFERTASRLFEMRSREYLALEHRTPPRAEDLEDAGPSEA